MQTNLIIVSEYCNKCHIDPSFILLLEEDGLISVQEIKNQKYILTSQLQDLERYTRMYYDLSINIAGIDAIRHLLGKMQSMQEEIHRLRSRLTIHRPLEYEEMNE